MFLLPLRGPKKLREQPLFPIRISRFAHRRKLEVSLFKEKGLTRIASNHCLLSGADSGNRTCDLFITSELLYQLSHVGAL